MDMGGRWQGVVQSAHKLWKVHASGRYSAGIRGALVEDLARIIWVIFRKRLYRCPRISVWMIRNRSSISILYPKISRHTYHVFLCCEIRETLKIKQACSCPTPPWTGRSPGGERAMWSGVEGGGEDVIPFPLSERLLCENVNELVKWVNESL